MEAGQCRNPMDVAGLVKTLGPPRWRGAEAYLYTVEWLGRRAVLKIRLPKSYRHPELDLELRWARTVTEARAILASRRAGVDTPRLYYADPLCTLVVLEYVEGKLLASIVEETPREAYSYAEKLGVLAGRLHEAGIAHGDLTTSNVIVTPTGKLYLIDFGLASLKASLREQAIDVHLYMRSLESTHPDHVEGMLSSFLKGYRSVRGEVTDKVMELVREIRLMGRYVAERRTAWGSG